MGIIGGIGVPELLIILVVALLIFGPKNLPKLGNALGKTVKNIRSGMEDEEPGKVEAGAEDAPVTTVEDVVEDTTTTTSTRTDDVR